MNNDIVIRGLLLWGSVNMTAISGKKLVEDARKAHSLSHVCTAALGRLLMQTAMMSVQLKSETDNLTVIFDGDGAAGRFVAVGHSGGVVKAIPTVPRRSFPSTKTESSTYRASLEKTARCASYAIFR